MNKYSVACCSNTNARVCSSRSRHAVHLPQRLRPDARRQAFSFLIQPPDALHSWLAASISPRRRRWRPAQPLAGWLASQHARATAGCLRAHATRPPLRRAAVRASVRGSGETLRAQRRRGVSGACCNFRSGRWFCLGNVLLTCSFRRLSALLRLFYDMLTPLSEHAATPNCVAQKVSLWRVSGCLLLVAELFDALRRIAGTSSLHRRAGATGPSAHAWRCEAARVGVWHEWPSNDFFCA